MPDDITVSQYIPFPKKYPKVVLNAIETCVCPFGHRYLLGRHIELVDYDEKHLRVHNGSYKDYQNISYEGVIPVVYYTFQSKPSLDVYYDKENGYRFPVYKSMWERQYAKTLEEVVHYFYYILPELEKE